MPRPKLYAKARLINHQHRLYNYDLSTDHGPVPGVFLNSGAVIGYATYFGYDIEWENAPW